MENTLEYLGINTNIVIARSRRSGAEVIFGALFLA